MAESQSPTSSLRISGVELVKYLKDKKQITGFHKLVKMQIEEGAVVLVFEELSGPEYTLKQELFLETRLKAYNDADISNRILNILIDAGIETFAEITVPETFGMLRKCRGFGEGSQKELIVLFSSKGIELSLPEPPTPTE